MPMAMFMDTTKIGRTYSATQPLLIAGGIAPVFQAANQSARRQQIRIVNTSVAMMRQRVAVERAPAQDAGAYRDNTAIADKNSNHWEEF